MTVYLLHFDPPFRHARHYIGFTPEDTAVRRIVEHLRGVGTPLVREAIKAGSQILVPHIWTGAPREFERWLKARRDTACWCPCCLARRSPGDGGRPVKPLPGPERMSARFLADKPVYPVADRSLGEVYPPSCHPGEGRDPDLKGT